jgi:hypothetical protein
MQIRTISNLANRSAKKTELLLQKQSDLEVKRLLRLKRDIGIRWNSTYDMIVRAIRLRIPIKSWLEAQIIKETNLDQLELTQTDWKKLKYLVALLRPFAEYTHLLGNTKDTTINHTWNVYNSLFDHLDAVNQKLHNKDTTVNPWVGEFITAIDAGIRKLRDYYTETGGPVEQQYALATILDPSQKLDVFNAPEWGRSYSKKYRQTFLDYWKTHYQEDSGNRSELAQPHPCRPKSLNAVFRMNRQLHTGRPSQSTTDYNEAERYLKAPVVNGDADTPVLLVWKTLELSYPSIAKMARDILAVPGKLLP